MEYINEMYDMHKEFNEADFGGILTTPRMLIKRNRNKWGWYEYRAHRDWKPIRHELKRATITLTDGCWDLDEGSEGETRGTMLHEMIHQYQCEVLNEAPHHNEIFHKWAAKLKKKYGVCV
jgi:hypothetical protein